MIRPNFWKSMRPSTFVVAASIAFVLPSAHATIEPLSVSRLGDLIVNHGSLTIDDKIFSNFRYEISGSFSGYNDALVMANDISVRTELLAGNLGLDFIGTWDVMPGYKATGKIEYDVRVNDPEKYLSDFHLYSDLTVSGNPAEGASFVRETVSDIDHINVQMTGFADNPLLIQQVNPGSHIPTDVAFTLPGVQPQFVHIESTISLVSLNDTTSVGLGHVQQSFSQSVVPEASTSTMLLSGLVGMVVVSRRLSQRQRQA